MLISEGHVTWSRTKKKRYSLYDNISKKENHFSIKLKTAQKCSCITKTLSRNEIDAFPEAKNSAKNNGKRGNPMQKRDFCKRLQWQ